MNTLSKALVAVAVLTLAGVSLGATEASAYGCGYNDNGYSQGSYGYDHSYGHDDGHYHRDRYENQDYGHRDDYRW